MAFKTRLSEYSREKLVENIDKDWFRELLEVLRNTGAFAEGVYSQARPISEMEHQGLNGRYRQGFVSCAEYIPQLAQPPKEKPADVKPPFGDLLQQTPNPKELITQSPKK